MITVRGSPTGPGRTRVRPTWRQRVAAAADGMAPAGGLLLSFTLEPGRWIDLDTIVEETLAGLRDAGVCRRGFAGLDAMLATRRDGDRPGVAVTRVAPGVLANRRAPGPVMLDATGDVLPRPGRTAAKRAWRDRLAVAWGDRPPRGAPVWVDLQLRVGGSLLGPLEPALDALEPVLGRDPRGRDWQEFFPNDHHIRWLRLRRSPTLSGQLRLRLGPLPG